MLGHDGPTYFHNVFTNRTRYALLLVSKDYEQSAWAQLERRFSQARELEGQYGVLIPVITDTTRPPWLEGTRIYFNLVNRPFDELITILCEKVQVFRTTGLGNTALAAAISASLGKSVSELSTADVEAIGKIEVLSSNEMISSLAGVERCINLEVLRLRTIGLWDLSPLQRLTRLRVLDLGPIPSEVYALSGGHRGMTGGIQELRPLAGLSQLITLGLRYQNIRDTTPLSTLRNLRELDLSYNQIDQIYPGILCRDVSVLSLQMNGLSNLEFLKELQCLRWLFIYGNPLGDLTWLLKATENGAFASDGLICMDAPDASDIVGNEVVAKLRERGVQVEFPDYAGLWYSSW